MSDTLTKKSRADMTPEEKAADNRASKLRKRASSTTAGGQPKKAKKEPQEPRKPREPQFDEEGNEIKPDRVHKSRAEMTPEEKAAHNRQKKMRERENKKNKQPRAPGGKGGNGHAQKGGGNGQWVFIPAAQLQGFGQSFKGFGKQAQQPQAQGHQSSPKDRLNTALRRLLERDVTKDECVYEMTEEKGKHVATLTISALTTDQTEFKGKPAANAKDAQASAAQKCLNVLAKEIKVANEKYEEEAAEKRKARAAIEKEKKAAKKADKEATA